MWSWSSFTTPAVAVIGLYLIGGTSPALADIINVPGDQPTIQAGIDAAQNGDEVVVADDVYTGEGNRDIDFNGKLITVRSANGPDNCIIDCQGFGRGFNFQSGETAKALVEGLTIANGFVSGGFGDGGGLRCKGSSPTIINCIISGNSANNGGGIYSHGGNVMVINCRLSDNSATFEGGGIYAFDGDPTVINSTVRGNSALFGGGIYADVLTNATVSNSIVWGNSPNQIEDFGWATVSYNCVDGGYKGPGNIDADPLFVDPDNGDYHLSPGSPCIDAADNTAVPKGITTDLDGNPRFVDDPDTKDTGFGDPPIVDMGSYEFQALVEATTPDDFDAFRGFHLSGDLADVLDSDDSDLCYNPGIVLNPTEAPVTLDFTGTLPNDSPAALNVTIESSANTVGLELTFSFWNFNTSSWDVVGTDTQSLNTDTVRTFVGTPADHVEPGTGEVRTRYEVRVVSFIFLFPWTDCVDHVFWTTN